MTMKVTGGLRYRICADCGELHDVRDWPGNHRKPGEALCAPQVIRDEMDPVVSQVDGSIHTSKRSIRKTYMPSGNREGKFYTEVGNDAQRHKPKPKYKPDGAAIRTSIEKAKARLARGEVTRETYERKVLTRPGPI